MRTLNAVLFVVATAFVFIPVLSAQETAIPAQTFDVQRDESAALSTIPAFVPKGKGKGIIEHRVRPLPALPPRSGAAKAAKSVVQASATAVLDIAPVVSFRGIGDGPSYIVEHIPSDTTGAIGDTQFVQWVNEAL